MALSNEEYRLKRKRSLLDNLERGTTSSRNPEYDTEEWIKELKADIDKAKHT
jgi:hypothetical protein